MTIDEHQARLARADRVADARAAIYGRELEALCDVADMIASGVVPTGALRVLAGRMIGDRTPEPQSLDAYRDNKRRLSEAEFDLLTRGPR